MELKIQEMAVADYNNINIRLRTVYENIKGEKYFIEISTGVVGENYRWIIITSLFRIDRKEDENLNYTKEASEVIHRYYKEHKEYNHKNINELFNELLGQKVELKYINTFEDGTYQAHCNGIYNLGNEMNKTQKITQLSLF